MPVLPRWLLPSVGTGKQTLKITLTAMETIPYERVFGPPIGAEIKKFCEEKGLRFVMNADVREIVGTDGHVSGLLLGSGEVIPAQAIIAGIGAQCVRQNQSEHVLVTYRLTR